MKAPIYWGLTTCQVCFYFVSNAPGSSPAKKPLLGSPLWLPSAPPGLTPCQHVMGLRAGLKRMLTLRITNEEAATRVMGSASLFTYTSNKYLVQTEQLREASLRRWRLSSRVGRSRHLWNGRALRPGLLWGSPLCRDLYPEAHPHFLIV